MNKYIIRLLDNESVQRVIPDIYLRFGRHRKIQSLPGIPTTYENVIINNDKTQILYEFPEN